ncbi:MAG: phosphopantothenate/pantothenate synthetase [Euryarchaeota archaeon]|nr:phosphopantothenate/pantothenate synthetase [Euryarchaeota archaeon]
MEIPNTHPRKLSLESRQKIVDGAMDGLLADSAMIAHGRGEAFDYLLGERTTQSASRAIIEASARLASAVNPVISVNGNTVLLAGEDAIRVAAVLGCSIEVNLYYRTPERVSGLISLLEEQRIAVSSRGSPSGFVGDWTEAVGKVSFLGLDPNFRILGLEGPRSKCTEAGIGLADTILVPLEDGDRCEALVGLGKEVLVIDLNPLSRSSMMASVTIVDEVSRAFKGILSELLSGTQPPSEWDNMSVLKEGLREISESVGRIPGD